MSRRVFIIGIGIWVLFLVIGFRLCFTPYFEDWPVGWSNEIPGDEVIRSQIRMVKERFPIRLARVVPSHLRNHSRQLEQGQAVPAQFDLDDWIHRECRNRFITYYGIWTISGFLVHWIVSRIIRGRMHLE